MNLRIIAGKVSFASLYSQETGNFKGSELSSSGFVNTNGRALKSSSGLLSCP